MLVLAFFSLWAVVVGFCLVLFPDRAIRFQQKFYEKINWRMEPISMKLELRNTRLMGIALVVLSLMTVAWILWQGIP